MNMIFERKLPIPKEVKRLCPLSPELEKVVADRAREIAEIFSGKSDKLVLIIGPCSADSEDSVIDYLSRLRRVQEKVYDKIFIIPRIYTNKPRSTGEGYKGMLHQPNPYEEPDMLKGIVAIRNLHMRAIGETGFSCADEMLYPENYRYLDDILGYVAVGARSVENQQHRLTASGIAVPVGMKNPTSGNLSVMLNAINAAQHRHTFIYRGWEVHSAGNPLTHAVLRGFLSKTGRPTPNYHYEDLELLCRLYGRAGLANPGVIIDTNHANSGKQPLRQPGIVRDVMHSASLSPDIRKLVKGFMIESYIEDGAQKLGECIYGKSITDPCLGWEKSERLIYDLAELV